MKGHPLRYFGEAPPYPPEGAERIDTPVGTPCDECGKLIKTWDSGLMVPTSDGGWAPSHRFCAMISDYIYMRERLHRAERWARLWKRAAKRYRVHRDRVAEALSRKAGKPQ